MVPVVTALMALLTLAGPARSSIPAGRFGVGDSIMLSSSEDLSALGWKVDAEVGRQFAAGVRVVRWRAARGTLPKRVIVHLGTNGWIDPSDCDELVAAAGPYRRIFLVTIKVPRGWQDANNDVLRACAARYAKVHLIRWYRHSVDHREWFAVDGYHLNADGQAAYASFLDAKVDAILARLAGGAAR